MHEVQEEDSEPPQESDIVSTPDPVEVQKTWPITNPQERNKTNFQLAFGPKVNVQTWTLKHEWSASLSPPHPAYHQ